MVFQLKAKNKKLNHGLSENKPNKFRSIFTKVKVVAKNVIWAGGEYQYPSQGGFIGSDLCLHNSLVEKYSELPGDDYLIIGGYESGIDAAYHLAKKGKKVKVFDAN